MPVLPIPDDWEGDWTCIQVQWPNSDKWLALLVGFLTTPTRGRFWDERTGSIKAVQTIGRQIDERNIPFIDCAGEETPAIPEPIIRNTIGAFELGEQLMSLCGYNPKAFKIEDGTLYVRDFCGEWVAIGALSDQPDAPPETEIPDPPPGELADSTPCAQASKLAVMVYNIVVKAFLETGGPEAIDIYDFYSDMRDFIPGVDLAFNDLMNIYFNVIALQIAGYENETKSLDAVDWLKCSWVDLIPDQNTGIDADTYQDLIDASSGALREAFGDSNFNGFGKTMRFVWERALKSIGAKDAQKITYYAQDDGLISCDCPEEPPEASSIWFDGTFTWAGDPDTTCEIEEVQYGGRRLKMRMTAPAGDFKSITEFQCNLANAQAGDTVTVRVYPEAGSKVPVDDWHDNTGYYTLPPEEWFHMDFTGGGTETRVNGADYVEWTNEQDDLITPTWAELNDARLYDEDGGPWDWHFFLEIIAVNGERLTPIGP